VVLVDPRTEDLPPVGLIEIEDLETGRRGLIDASDATVRTAVRARASSRRIERTSVFRRAGIEGVEIHLDQDTVAPLVGYFRRREKWRAAGR
jgi:hypothetical protein